VGHLRTVGEEAADYHLRLDGSPIPWPLAALWVGGELLDGPSELEETTIVLMLDEPTAEVSWLALNPAGEWIASRLRLPKLPIRWFYRPAAYPAWSHEVRRVVRFWSAGQLDQDVIERLRDRRFDQLNIVQPTPAELAAQVATDLADSRRHLRRVLDGYWKRKWRGDHEGKGTGPEDHLWRAAQAVRELEDAEQGSLTLRGRASARGRRPAAANRVCRGCS
jgi:hypothetical protein